MSSSLVRALVSRAAFPAIRRLTVPASSSLLRKTLPLHYRLISTSGKNKDSVTASHGHVDVEHSQTEKVENIADKDENWVSFGFDLVDRQADEFTYHTLMFVGFTFCICFGTFFLAYFPDFKDIAWTQREAYLELERRQKEGLPLIDRNLIDPAKIHLPSEEELGDYNIII